MQSDLAIIIVNWNGGDFLRRCLASLDQFPPQVQYTIVVVDNASSDGSREWLDSLGDRIRLIANKENVGFGRANNQAFSATDAPLLFLLNSDAEVHEGTLDTLVATINESEKIGAVGPRLLNTDGTLQPSVWRNPPSPGEMIVIAFGLFRLLPKRQRESLLGIHWDHSHRLSAHMLSAAALLLKRKVIEDVGGFDERFHMYGEDNELALRMVRSGWLMLFEPKATVTHHAGKSTERRWSDLEKLAKKYEGFFRLQRIHLSRGAAVANLMTGYGLATIRQVWLTLRRRPLEENRLVRRLYGDELRQMLSATKPNA